MNKPSSGLPWVLRVAREHWGRNFVNVRRGHESCFIAYIQEGTLTVGRGNERLDARSGSVVYLPREPRLRDVGVASAQGVRLIIIVVREGDSSGPVAAALGNAVRVFTPGDGSSIEPLFYCLLQAAGKSYPAASDIAARLLLPTLQIIREEQAQAEASEKPGCRLFNRCREHILHQYLAIHHVADVARQFGTPHARLCRLFRQHEGCAPHRFLLQRKMTHALYELQQRGRSVGEIAYELGFADPYSFSKAFKRVMGHNPSMAKPVHHRVSSRPHVARSPGAPVSPARRRRDGPAPRDPRSPSPVWTAFS